MTMNTKVLDLAPDPAIFVSDLQDANKNYFMYLDVFAY
jgi:hypothetical protein